MNSYKQCVLNACRCRKGSHVLFRGFGLNAVDEPAKNPRLELAKLFQTYYPEITSFKITPKTGDFESGSFNYDVVINGIIPED